MHRSITRRTALLGLCAFGWTLKAAWSAPASDAHTIAPTGILRVAIAISPAPGTFWAGRDPASGEPKGVTADLGRAMAEKLGVPLKLVVYENSGAITDAGDSGGWDVTFVPADATRRQRLDFGPVYNGGESTFLVRPGVAITTLADVDSPGIRVAGISNTTTIRALTAWLTNTTPKSLPTVETALDQLRSGEIDAFGLNRDALATLSPTVPGSHVLPGHFFETTLAVAVPKGHTEALHFASAFVAGAKTSGLIRRIFDANGLKDQAVAP
jgi:polar amino acid transport system substrate-binding protein